MTDPDPLAQLNDALTRRRLDVDRVEDTFNVSQGKGIMAHKAHLDPRPLLDALSDDAEERRRQIAAYASGVKHVLLEPSRSKASEWDFVESAGGLLPGIHASTFELGVKAAAGEPPWTREFTDDLVAAYFIKLDRGIRVLTTPQVERWDVSDDRITSAARSLLFHKTRHHDFELFDGADHVKRMHTGDGHDAARCLVVEDVFYSDVDARFRFALPTPEHLLCVFDDTDEAICELRAKANAVYNAEDYPLTTQIFRFQSGRPVPIEETDDE